MPREETKELEVAADEDMHPVVREFAEFGTTGELDDAIMQFVDEHCEKFEGVELDGDMDLSFTDLHNKFIEMIELHMEAFCKVGDISCAPASPRASLFRRLRYSFHIRLRSEDGVLAVRPPRGALWLADRHFFSHPPSFLLLFSPQNRPSINDKPGTRNNSRRGFPASRRSK